MLGMQQRSEKELKKVVKPEDAPVALRLVLHDAATYDVATGKGGLNGSIVTRCRSQPHYPTLIHHATAAADLRHCAVQEVLVHVNSSMCDKCHCSLMAYDPWRDSGSAHMLIDTWVLM